MNLIYDRTAADAARWETLRDKGYVTMTAAEKVEWNAGMKGAYNTTDLNRVETAVLALASALNAAGYAVDVATKTDWAWEDIPSPEDLTRYLANVEAIREALTVLETTPQTPESMAKLKWDKANDIEKILADVDDAITRMPLSFWGSGEIGCGEQ